MYKQFFMAALCAASLAVSGCGKHDASGASAPGGDNAPVRISVGSYNLNNLPFFIAETDLLAGTSHFVASPVAGHVTKCTTVVKKAVTTGGAITVEIGGVAVAGLSVVVADSSAVGDIDTDQPTTPTESTAVIAKDGAIEIVGDAAFATAGELHGFVEVTF